MRSISRPLCSGGIGRSSLGDPSRHATESQTLALPMANAVKHHHSVYVILPAEAVAKHPSVVRLNPNRDPSKPCVDVGLLGLPVLQHGPLRLELFLLRQLFVLGDFLKPRVELRQLAPSKYFRMRTTSRVSFHTGNSCAHIRSTCHPSLFNWRLTYLSRRMFF